MTRRPSAKGAIMTLDQLDRWLCSDDAPDDSMMLSDLDGFLTALIVGPVFVHPETWLPSVWGNKHIVQPAGRNGERALQAIVARYNEISAMLADAPGTWAPIFLQHPDGTPIPGDWAEGFFDAIKLSIDAWAPFMADLETAKHLTMILVYCGDNEGQNLLPTPPELRDQILGTAHRLIPESVIAIRAACMPARVAQAKADAAPNRRKSPR